MEALTDILLLAILFIITLSLILMMSAVRSSTKRINDQNDKRNKELLSTLIVLKESNEVANKNAINVLKEIKNEIIATRILNEEGNTKLINTLNEVTKLD